MISSRVQTLITLALGIGLGVGAMMFWPGSSEQSSPSGGVQAPGSPPASQPSSQPSSQPHGDHEHASAEEVWTCSMHPQIRQPEAGQCPLCGMDLIPATADAPGGGSDAPEQIVLSERAKALARLVTTPVQRQASAARVIRLSGQLTPDETTLKTVTAWTGGRIDRLHVKVTGQRIKAGQTIATLYSPEIFAAHQDLLVARRQVERLARSPEATRKAAEAALEAARTRLSLLGVPSRTLARMEKARKPTRSTSIRSPFAGTVIDRLATEGVYVTTGAPLYQVARLSRLWVQLDAYESDLPALAVGQRVELMVEGRPGETFEGAITFVDPVLDPRRRTARVRVEVDNPDGRLKPGMFVEAVVDARAEDQTHAPLVVPASALLFTGRRAIAYVEVQGPDRRTYEARVVRPGPRMGDQYAILAGLAEGERVVARGAFVLDADLQIRGGRSMMAAPDDRALGALDGEVALSAKERASLAPVVQAYLDAQQALAADDLAQAKAGGQTLLAALEGVSLSSAHAQAARWPVLAAGLRDHVNPLIKTPEIKVARVAFGGLSEVMTSLLQTLGNPLDQPLSLAFCPMALDNRGAAWVQRGGAVDNAYFGAEMRMCGEIRQQVEPGAHLISTPAEGAP